MTHLSTRASLAPALSFCFFFFNDTATTEIYTLSLHDALPICLCSSRVAKNAACGPPYPIGTPKRCEDRKSTRLNSSHSQISYAVFCLKKKKRPTQKRVRRDQYDRHGHNDADTVTAVLDMHRVT